jgi:hypothetical protein
MGMAGSSIARVSRNGRSKTFPAAGFTQAEKIFPSKDRGWWGKIFPKKFPASKTRLDTTHRVINDAPRHAAPQYNAMRHNDATR